MKNKYDAGIFIDYIEGIESGLVENEFICSFLKDNEALEEIELFRELMGLNDLQERYGSATFESLLYFYLGSRAANETDMRDFWLMAAALMYAIMEDLNERADSNSS